MESITIDMDEVITDTTLKLKEWYLRDHGIIFKNEEIQGKDLKDVVIPEHFSVFRQYLNTPGFFRDLNLMSDADYVLKKLNEKYELYILSAAMEFPNSLKDKYDWIMEKLPFMTWQQVCLCGSKSIMQSNIMIDDRTRNFSHFKGRKILYSAHHNFFEQDYERVHCWQEIAEKLL